jgi:alpha-1,6-mannosyltransferase
MNRFKLFYLSPMKPSGFIQGVRRGEDGGTPPLEASSSAGHAPAPSAVPLTLSFLTGLVYLVVFTLPFPLARFYATIPPVDYAKLTHYSAANLIAFVLGLIILFGVYDRLLKAPIPAWLPYSGLIFALILFFSYPTLAIDLFIYAIRTRGWGLYGLNPLATSPADLPPTDPWLNLAAEWSNAPSPYGPLWEVLSLGAFKLTGGNFLAHLFALKVIAILSYVAAIWLIGAVLETLKPEWKLKGMLAFAWNPLVLLETAQNGHNDIVMVVFLLAAIWALVRGKDLGVTPLLALSVLVKFMTVVVAPFFILYLAFKHRAWPRRMTVFIGHSLVFAALVVLPMAPLWPGLDAWAVLKAGSGAGRSVMALSVLVLRSLEVGNAFDLSRIAVNGLFAALSLWFLWQKRRAFSHPTGPIFAAWAIFFWYVLLAAPVFHGWYLLWFLPLAGLLLPESKPFRASLVFSFTALLIIPYFETIRIWFPVLLENHLLGHLIGVPLLVLPPALMALGKDSGNTV